MTQSYTYYDGSIRKHTEPIRPDWSRFHSCNAQYSYQHIEKPNMDVYQLISYATPIAQYKRFNYPKDEIACTEILALSYLYDYSPTTTRQLTRWLSEIKCTMTLHDIRKIESHPCHTYNHLHMIQGTVKDGKDIYIMNSKDLEKLFQS